MGAAFNCDSKSLTVVFVRKPDVLEHSITLTLPAPASAANPQ